MNGLLALDLDGVLLIHDSSWDLFHRLLGTTGRKRDRNMELFFTGQIDYNRWAKLDAGLWEGMRISPVEEHLRGLALTDGASGLVEAMSSIGVRTAIISTGISLVAERVAEKLGIEDIIANDVEVVRGRITGKVTVRCAFDEKGSVLSEMARRFSVSMDRTACIGDAENDLTMFDASGFSIAFNPSSDRVAERATLTVRGASLRPARDALVEHFLSLD